VAPYRNASQKVIIKTKPMEIYKQGDPRWGKMKINGTSSTLSGYGCFICSLASLAGMTPPEALTRLEKAGAFNRDLIISDKAALALGLEYTPPARSADFNPTFVCIVEVDYKPETTQKEQHFCVYFPDGKIGDPIDGKIKKNPYRIISYRLFKEKKNWEALYNQALKDQKQAEELAEEAREECAKLQKQLDQLEEAHLKELLPAQQDIEELKSENAKLKYQVDFYREHLEEDERKIEAFSKEIERLEAIQTRDIQNTTIPQAFSFLLSVITKK
jgi:hypothetical protein